MESQRVFGKLWALIIKACVLGKIMSHSQTQTTASMKDSLTGIEGDIGPPCLAKDAGGSVLPKAST